MTCALLLVEPFADVAAKLRLCEQAILDNERSVKRLKGDQASFIGEIGWNKHDIQSTKTALEEQAAKLNAMEKSFTTRTVQCLNNQIQMHTSCDDLSEIDDVIDNLTKDHDALASRHKQLELSANLRINRLTNHNKTTQTLLADISATMQLLLDSHDRSDRNLARALVRIRVLEDDNAAMSARLVDLLN
jgi:chromosome segregation ATPase